MKPGNLRDNVRCQYLQTREGLDDEGRPKTGRIAGSMLACGLSWRKAAFLLFYLSLGKGQYI